MEPRYSGENSGNLAASDSQIAQKFKSVRRIFRILDLVSRRGEDLTAKRLACEIGISLSSCYYLINILADEGYIEKIAHCGGYRIGPTISLLEANSRSDLASKIEPLVEELGQRTQRHAYSAMLSYGEMMVTHATVPPKSPPVGVVKGFHGGSHALALGKILLASRGAEYVEDYIDNHGLEAFTPRTIVQPSLLHSHLNKVRMVGVAVDLEEFAQNLCCVAAPVKPESGKVEATIGLSTTTQRFCKEGQYLVRMVQGAAEEASALLKENPYTGA